MLVVLGPLRLDPHLAKSVGCLLVVRRRKSKDRSRCGGTVRLVPRGPAGLFHRFFMCSHSQSKSFSAIIFAKMVLFTIKRVRECNKGIRERHKNLKKFSVSLRRIGQSAGTFQLLLPG